MNVKKFLFVGLTCLVATAVFAGEKVTTNPVTGKDLSIRMFAAPLFIVGSYNKNGDADYAVIDRGGVMTHSPDRFGIGVKKSRATADNILYSKAFTVAFADVNKSEQMKIIDFVGTRSQKDVSDKARQAGITDSRSVAVDAPAPENFPYVLHCRLVDTIEAKGMYFFVGEVKKVEADPSYFDVEGHFTLANPIYFNHNYVKPGESVGKSGTLAPKN